MVIFSTDCAIENLKFHNAFHLLKTVKLSDSKKSIDYKKKLSQLQRYFCNCIKLINLNYLYRMRSFDTVGAFLRTLSNKRSLENFTV
jgi:hypothetical protein